VKKFCPVCNIEKDQSQFQKQKGGKNGLRALCTLCKRQARKNYYQQNKEKELKLNKRWVNKNKEKVQRFRLDYRKRPKYKAYQKKYRTEHRKERAAYQSKLEKENISYRIASRLRHRLYTALKANKTSKSYSVMYLLGCDMNIFKEYLSDKFKEGMSWENYGAWHIDHIKPCALFDLTDIQEQKKCFHYSNLQPLWAEENLHKNTKIID